MESHSTTEGNRPGFTQEEIMEKEKEPQELGKETLENLISGETRDKALNEIEESLSRLLRAQIKIQEEENQPEYIKTAVKEINLSLRKMREVNTELSYVVRGLMTDLIQVIRGVADVMQKATITQIKSDGLLACLKRKELITEEEISEAIKEEVLPKYEQLFGDQQPVNEETDH